MPQNDLHLKLLLPHKILIDEPITQLTAEAENGAFCLLPRHIDFVAALVPGITFFHTPDGIEHFVAIDRGTLVKCGQQILISAYNAIVGADLERLRATVEERFIEIDERERIARSALARLEAGTIRHFMELERGSHG